jgi:hypothetical protein
MAEHCGKEKITGLTFYFIMNSYHVSNYLPEFALWNSGKIQSCQICATYKA